MGTAGSFVESGGYRLNCVVEGEGTPTLVIGSSVYYPRVFSSNLRKSLRLAFCDHRGFAMKVRERSAASIDMSVLLKDVELVREQLGWERFVLIGHSGHSNIALEYARRYPERVTHLVLLNAGPNNGTANMEALERDWSELVAPERQALWRANVDRLPAAIEADPARRFVLFMLAMGPRSWYRYDFDAAHLWDGVPVNLEIVDHMWGVIFRDIDIAPALRELRMPVYLGLGTHDYLVPPARTWEPLRSLVRDLTVRIFDRSGHAPMLEVPELFDSDLLAWLRARR